MGAKNGKSVHFDCDFCINVESESGQERLKSVFSYCVLAMVHHSDRRYVLPLGHSIFSTTFSKVMKSGKTYAVAQTIVRRLANKSRGAEMGGLNWRESKHV